MRAFPILTSALLLPGCAALTEGAAPDAQGCRPAMAIYQPPVRMGGTGTILHIPRTCPPRVPGSTDVR